jgi:hypothetical protein
MPPNFIDQQASNILDTLDTVRGTPIVITRSGCCVHVTYGDLQVKGTTTRDALAHLCQVLIAEPVRRGAVLPEEYTQTLRNCSCRGTPVHG